MASGKTRPDDLGSSTSTAGRRMVGSRTQAAAQPLHIVSSTRQNSCTFCISDLSTVFCYFR
eukprot:COSAG06_NODE_10143_length_1736_cov_2.643118_1_plen_61_part_00